jgi:drug/metabolite transporter (DMT)-like permease
MNKSQLIWGIICLALAVLLTVLAFVLPAGTITFMVEGTNMPWVPPVVLGILGIMLLATTGKRETEAAQAAQPRIVDEEKAALNKRLETMGWGCFLIMLSGFALVPHDVIAKGVWSIGVGVVMLGLNVARYFYKIKMSGFTTFLGVVSLISGITQLLGVHKLEGAILLITLGAYLIIKPWFDKRQLFGKAEEG